MPQPYRGKEKPVYGHNALLSRPDLAAHIAAIAGIWTVIEEQWGMLLAEMLGAEAVTGVEIYLSLTGTGSQNATITTIANMRLDDPDRETFTNLLRDQRPRAEERNRVVHGRWGILPSKTDRLMLFERSWTQRTLAALIAHQEKPSANALGVRPKFQMPNAAVVYYTKRDFEQIEGRLLGFSNALGDFTTHLRTKNLGLVPRTAPPPPPRSQLADRGPPAETTPTTLSPEPPPEEKDPVQ